MGNCTPSFWKLFTFHILLVPLGQKKRNLVKSLYLFVKIEMRLEKELRLEVTPTAQLAAVSYKFPFHYQPLHFQYIWIIFVLTHLYPKRRNWKNNNSTLDITVRKRNSKVMRWTLVTKFSFAICSFIQYFFLRKSHVHLTLF